MNRKILAFVYCSKTKKWLSLRNADNPGHEGNFWFTVTGNLEYSESYEICAKREVKEETGLEIKEIKDLNWGTYYKFKGRENEEHYFLAIVKEDKVILNEEHDSYEWLYLNDYVERINWMGNKKELQFLLQECVDKGKPFYWGRMDDFISKFPKVHLAHDNKNIDLTWFENSDFSSVKPIRQVSNVCFNDNGEILIVKPIKDWQLPGGKPEGDESFEETARREAEEEANIEMGELFPLGYNKIEVFDESGKKKDIFYQLRYFSVIKKMNPAKVDPAVGRIAYRKFIKPEDFLTYCPWGATGEACIKKACEFYSNYKKGLI